MSNAAERLRAELARRGLDWIVPDWPAPANVGALVTTRNAAPGEAMYPAQASAWEESARRLRKVTGMQPLWLRQVHGARVAVAGADAPGSEGDAAISRLPNIAAAVQTADCLPVLLCDRAGSVVAAAHAGWRGLAAGVLENTVRAMNVAAPDLIAWMGPAIGPDKFEVGEDVYAAFCASDVEATRAFVRQGRDKWLADLYALARLRLTRVGVHAVHGGGACTFTEADRFYSYRRDKTTGRMVALVWMEHLD